jgi:hypothetical protein
MFQADCERPVMRKPEPKAEIKLPPGAGAGAGAEITKCEFQRLEEKIMVAKKVFVNGIIYFLSMKNMQDPELIQHLQP